MALMHQRESFPLTSQSLFNIRPGHVSLISISAVKITSSDDLGTTLSPTQRNCYLTNEKKLRLHKTYTQSNCILECRLEFAANLTLQKYNMVLY